MTHQITVSQFRGFTGRVLLASSTQDKKRLEALIFPGEADMVVYRIISNEEMVYNDCDFEQAVTVYNDCPSLPKVCLHVKELV